MVSRLRWLLLTSISISAAFAQNTAGLAGMTGVVRDPSGSVIPHAKVEISNASKGIARSLVTNDAGLFSAPALTPAPGYAVVVTSPGFTAYQAKDLELAVGQTLDLNVLLAVAGSAQQVEISAAPSLVEDTKTDVSTVVNSLQIQELPINGRRVDSFVLLTPGVSNDGTFGLLSFRGVAGGNAFLVDGDDTTEQFYNENAGRTRIASQISQDAVQEFQVLSANFSAEYGRAMGGVVNTVTRSGGNDVHGTAYWFFRNRTLNARDRYASFNPPEVRHQTGASIGGRIVKDKLFYFLNTEISRRNFPIASSIVRPGVISNGQFLGCGAPATPAQCAAIDTILPRYFGQVPRQANQELAFGKIDWRPSERNSFTASFNFLRFMSEDGLQSAAAINTGAAIGTNANDSVRVRNGSLAWTAIPNASMVNESRFSWFTDRQADDFNQSLIPPGIGLITLSVGGQSNLGAGASYLPRVEPNEQRFQFTDGFSWVTGKHNFKFGVDISSTEDYQYFLSTQFGSYNYSNVTNFALDFSGNEAGGKHWSTYSQGFGNPVVDTTVGEYGFYAQDQFRVTRNLTVNYGLRYDYTTIPQPTIVNHDYPQTGRIPNDTMNLAPRIGVAYSFDRQRMTLRAGYGIFFSRFESGLIQNLFQNNGVYQSFLSLTGANAPQLASGPVYPNILTSSAGAKGSSSLQFAAPDLRTPYTEQGSAALERQVSSDIRVTASYIWSRGVRLLGASDLNIGALGPNVTYKILDASGNVTGNYTTPAYLLSNRVNPNYSRVYQVENGLNSYYNALAVDARKRFTKGLQASIAYTWGHEIDYNVEGGGNAIFFSGVQNTFNGNYKFDKGSGWLDQRHRMIISFVEQPTFTHRSGAFYRYVVNNWQLSAITTLASGRPFTPSIQVSDVTPFPGAAFTSTLNGYGGLNRAPFLPIDDLYSPPAYRTDARLAKIVPIGERDKLYLMFEVFNVSNTIADTSIYSQAYTEKSLALTPTPGLGVGSASGGFPDGTNARRAQVGVRFTF